MVDEADPVAVGLDEHRKRLRLELAAGRTLEIAELYDGDGGVRRPEAGAIVCGHLNGPRRGLRNHRLLPTPAFIGGDPGVGEHTQDKDADRGESTTATAKAPGTR